MLLPIGPQSFTSVGGLVRNNLPWHVLPVGAMMLLLHPTLIEDIRR